MKIKEKETTDMVFDDESRQKVYEQINDRRVKEMTKETYLDKHERNRHLEIIKEDLQVSEALATVRFASQCNFRLRNRVDRLTSVIKMKDQELLKLLNFKTLNEHYLRTIDYQKRLIREYVDKNLLNLKKINDISNIFDKQKRELQAHIEELSLKVEQLTEKLAHKTTLQKELAESVKLIKSGQTNVIYEEKGLTIIHPHFYRELIEKEMQLDKLLPVSPARLATKFKNHDRKMLDLINHVARELNLQTNTHTIAEFCYYLMLNIDRESVSIFETLPKEQEMMG